MLYNSEYQPISSTGGVLGTSLVDLTSISFADLFAQATDYAPGTTYNKGTLAYNQNTIWVYINSTASSGNAPPALPAISNTYWELVGSAGTFTWIAYATSADGATNFTTNTYDTGGITRTFIGIANNKTSAVESGIYTDYSWSKFVGTDGASAKSMVITTDRQLITFDSSGLLSPTPQNINLTANKQNTTATVNWTIKDTAGNVLTPSSYLNNTAGDTTQMTGAQFRSALLVNGTQGLVITATLIDGITIVDTITVMKLQAAVNGTSGTSPIVASLTKLSVAIGTDSNGDNAIFAGSGTEIRITEGQTILSFDGAGTSGTGNATGGTTASTWKITSRVSTNVTIGTIITDSGAFATVSDISAITSDTGSIVYSISGTNTSGTSFTTSITQSFVRLKGVVVDVNPPAVPAGLALTSNITTTPAGDIQVKLVANWTANTESDFSYYEVQIKEGTGGYISYNVPSNIYEWLVKPNTSYTVQLRAIDKNGNRSGYATAVALTSTRDTIAPGVPTSITASAAIKNIFLNWTNASDTDLSQVQIFENTTNTIPATPIATVNARPSDKGGFTRAALVTSTTYYYWLKSVDSSGNISAATTAVSVTPIALANSDITAGTINADKIQSGTITGDRFDTGTSLPGTITVGVTGVSIETVRTNAATGASDPATRINAATTTIDPGKILISGATTLSNWRNGTDATKIEGGSIAANTITANKIEIGIRGVDIAGITFQCSVDSAGVSTNIVTWTTGTIVYTNDSGVITTASITAGTSAAWSTGIIYFYWTKGGTIIATTTASGTAYGTDKIVLATYSGGFNLVVNYGKTIIDGSQITTGTITGTQVKANSITASQINANGLSIKDASGNIILSAGSAVNFASLTTSFPNATNTGSVSNSGITISAGAINGIGTGSGTIVDNNQVSVGGKNLITGSSSGTGWSGFTARTDTTYSLTTASAGESAYIYSSYFNIWGNQEITLSFESTEDSSILSRDFFILPDNYASIGLLTQSFPKSASGWTKYSFTLTTPAAWGTITSPISARLRMDHNGSTGGVSATISIRKVKLEVGNKATDWSPAPEDLVSVDLSNAPSTIKNSTIAINASNGQITGIGTGANTTVANNQIAISASNGQITGIGTGANTTVANNQIAISASNGQITGIGTGVDTTVANNQIKVTGGTITGIGTGSGAYIASNLEESSSWIPNSAVPWGLNGGANENSIVFDVGPKGATVPVWRCISSGDGEADGGWNHNNAFTIYPSKTYRFMVPVKFNTITGSSGAAYWGIDGNTVCDLNTTTLNSNPYFHAVTRSSFSTGRWYLMVGYIYPAGTTGASSTGAHVYDMTTGAIVSNGANYTWAASATTSGTRAYQYYAATAGNIQVFGQPVVEVVDGSESSINELLQASAIFNQNITLSSGAINGIGTGAGTVVANDQIAVNVSGQITGIGTGINTVVANSQIAISGAAITGIGIGNNTAVANGAITIGSDGAISGAGGGQVTIGGLGYTGDLNATNGATIGSNLGGTFTEAEFNARFNASVIGGTYIKDAAITDAKIANLSANKITSGSISTSLLVLDGLRLTNSSGNLSIQSGGVDTAQIALQSVTRVVAVNSPSQINPTANTWTTFNSATINVTSGTSVRLDASLRVLSQVSSSFGSDAQIRIIRAVGGVNTTVLSTFISTISAASFTIEFEGGFGTGTFNYNMATNPSVVFVDAHNSSGAILYTVQVLQNGGTGFENLTFVCTEIRR